MLKPRIHLSALEGVDFILSQDSDFDLQSNSDEMGCSCSDPFSSCIRLQVMLEDDFSDLEQL